jgi:uncharacterized small protein (DUF1192 family)
VEHVVKRLGMAQEEIRRLSHELQVKEKEQSRLGELSFQRTFLAVF